MVVLLRDSPTDRQIYERVKLTLALWCRVETAMLLNMVRWQNPLKYLVSSATGASRYIVLFLYFWC